MGCYMGVKIIDCIKGGYRCCDITHQFWSLNMGVSAIIILVGNNEKKLHDEEALV